MLPTMSRYACSISVFVKSSPSRGRRCSIASTKTKQSPCGSKVEMSAVARSGTLASPDLSGCSPCKIRSGRVGHSPSALAPRRWTDASLRGVLPRERLRDGFVGPDPIFCEDLCQADNRCICRQRRLRNRLIAHLNLCQKTPSSSSLAKIEIIADALRYISRPTIRQRFSSDQQGLGLVHACRRRHPEVLERAPAKARLPAHASMHPEACGEPLPLCSLCSSPS